MYVKQMHLISDNIPILYLARIFSILKLIEQPNWLKNISLSHPPQADVPFRWDG